MEIQRQAATAALPKELQLDLLSEFHLLPEELEDLDSAALAEFSEAPVVDRCRRRRLSYLLREASGSGPRSSGPAQRTQFGTSSIAPTCRWMRKTSSSVVPRNFGSLSKRRKRSDVTCSRPRLSASNASLSPREQDSCRACGRDAASETRRRCNDRPRAGERRKSPGIWRGFAAHRSNSQTPPPHPARTSPRLHCWAPPRSACSLFASLMAHRR